MNAVLRIWLECGCSVFAGATFLVMLAWVSKRCSYQVQQVHALQLVPAVAPDALLFAAGQAAQTQNAPPLASPCDPPFHAEMTFFDASAMCATSPIGYFYIHNSCNQTVSFTITVSVSDSESGSPDSAAADV